MSETGRGARERARHRARLRGPELGAQRHLPETLPDLGVDAYAGVGTVAAACAVGILWVGLAPLLTARRASRMDVPSTPRVVE